MLPPPHRTLIAVALILVWALTEACNAPAFAQSHDQLGELPRSFVSVPDPVVALEHVSLIDGTGAPPVADQTVLIGNGRIHAIGPTDSIELPERARRLDLRGSTVLPGIVGVHNHIHYSAIGWRTLNLTISSPRLYLASGVTTIRVAGSYAPYQDLNLRRSIDSGREPGPRMHLSGPYLTGENPVLPSMAVVRTPAQARELVRHWAGLGADWFKVYTTLTREVMAAVIDEAHRHGGRVTGHLCSVGYVEATKLGIDNVEHGLFGNTEYYPTKEPDVCPPLDFRVLTDLEIGGKDVRRTFRAMIDKGVVMTSTLPVFETLVGGRPEEFDPRVLEALHPSVAEAVLGTYEALQKNAGAGIPVAAFQQLMAYERAFVEAGGLLAAGVDNSGSGAALAGFGDQRGFELLVEAGFSPVEAIRIMTLNGATLLGIDEDLGSVEVGKIADLVVVDGDPAARPRDLRKVTHVFKEGVGYDSEALIRSVAGTVGLH